MSAIQTFDSPAAVPRSVAEQCLSLCWDDSEMRGHFQHLAGGEVDRVPGDLRLTVALIEGEDYELRAVGWASLSIWHFMWQMQVFVGGEYRQKGLGTALCSLLLLTHPERDGALAVFHDHCYRIAKHCGWRDVRLYKRVDDGWINVAFPRGDDAAGLHDAAPEVCGVPLATGEEGPLA